MRHAEHTPAEATVSPVRIVIARCSVNYAGRLTAHLPPALRLLIVKADSSVLIHSDGGSYKPLNWMPPPCRLTEEPGRWVVTGKAGETLTIEISEILSDTSFALGDDPGLVKDGVESHLQELPAAQPDVLRAGCGRRAPQPHAPSPPPPRGRRAPAAPVPHPTPGPAGAQPLGKGTARRLPGCHASDAGSA